MTRALPLRPTKEADGTEGRSLGYQPSASVTVVASRSSGVSHVSVSLPSLTFTTFKQKDGQEVNGSPREDTNGRSWPLRLGHGQCDPGR